MKNLIISAFVLFLFGVSFTLDAQIVKRLKNYNAVCLNENVDLFPRGFVYKTSEPDSVFYFGCFSSDKSDLVNYIEKGKGFKRNVQDTVYRCYGTYCDTIALCSLETMLTKFKVCDNEQLVPNLHEYDYIILYYISKNSFDRFFMRNIRFLHKYSLKYENAKIKFLVVQVS
jgi:hypothetical protein